MPRQRNIPELSTSRQPSPPTAETATSNPPTTTAAAIAIRCRLAQATNSAAATSTNASAANDPRKPIFGISTKPVSNTPPTAPSVFHVNNRPTRSPSRSEVSETTRIQSGSTAPMAAAGRPKNKNGKHPGHDLVITIPHDGVVQTGARMAIHVDQGFDVEYQQANPSRRAQAQHDRCDFLRPTTSAAARQSPRSPRQCPRMNAISTMAKTCNEAPKIRHKQRDASTSKPIETAPVSATNTQPQRKMAAALSGCGRAGTGAWAAGMKDGCAACIRAMPTAVKPMITLTSAVICKVTGRPSHVTQKEPSQAARRKQHRGCWWNKTAPNGGRRRECSFAARRPAPARCRPSTSSAPAAVPR